MRRPGPSGIAVRVTDDGPGISSDFCRTFSTVRHGKRSGRSATAGRARVWVLPSQGNHGSTWRLDSRRESGRRRATACRFVMLFRERMPQHEPLACWSLTTRRRSFAFSSPRSKPTTTRCRAPATVAEAIKRIAADAPDIVLLDLGLARRRRQGCDSPGARMVGCADHRSLRARPRSRKDRVRSISAPTTMSTSPSTSAN